MLIAIISVKVIFSYVLKFTICDTVKQASAYLEYTIWSTWIIAHALNWLEIIAQLSLMAKALKIFLHGCAFNNDLQILFPFPILY
jgi:uncharacterized membrane protein YcaP (DUF421 family)